ncbi:hypothetical protein LXL04_020732 [Taraxacum kok-saghyz]
MKLQKDVEFFVGVIQEKWVLISDYNYSFGQVLAASAEKDGTDLFQAKFVSAHQREFQFMKTMMMMFFVSGSRSGEKKKFGEKKTMNLDVQTNEPIAKRVKVQGNSNIVARPGNSCHRVVYPCQTRIYTTRIWQTRTRHEFQFVSEVSNTNTTRAKHGHDTNTTRIDSIDIIRLKQKIRKQNQELNQMEELNLNEFNNQSRKHEPWIPSPDTGRLKAKSVSKISKQNRVSKTSKTGRVKHRKSEATDDRERVKPPTTKSLTHTTENPLTPLLQRVLVKQNQLFKRDGEGRPEE